MSLSPAFVGAAAAAARPPRRAATRGVPAAAAAASSSPWAGRASAVVAGGAAASPRRRRHPHPPHPHTHGSGGGGGPAPAPGPRHPPATPPRADASDLPPLPLSEAAVQEVLVEARDVLGTMFGSSAENRDIGITGDVTLVEVDGPFVTLRLSGRFWHKRTDVMARVATYLQSRIPEIADVSVESADQLNEHAT